VIVEAEGWRIAFLTAGAVAALGAAVAIARRHSVEPYPV
jgi:hypothetical protein